ncbi:zinc-binding dehydrogenase [Anaerolineales bacterium HSG6]|nr:zinc-binding dehydrogenase [Anaerolineales bacterium HSG6]
MKALVLDAPGAPDSLYVTDLPMPTPTAGEVRVKVEAVGLNPVDYKVAAWGNPAWQYPFVLGLDVAGTIDALGDNVTEWHVGDRVVYHGNLACPGGYAEYATTPTHVITALPANIPFTDAAAIPCVGYTAYQALFRKLRLAEGQTVLIHAGAGGVGGFAIQLAVLAKAMIITTCSQRNIDYVKQLGADYVIDYQQESIKERVMKITGGRGVEAIVDTLSSDSATAGLEMLAYSGGIACVAGFVDCQKMEPFSKALSIHEVALGAAYGSGDLTAQKDLARMGGEIIDLLHTGSIDPMVSEIVTLEEIPQALNRLAERHVRGKIVATI